MADGSPLIIGDDFGASGLTANVGTQRTSLTRGGGGAAIAFEVENAKGIAIYAGTGDDSPAIAAWSHAGHGVTGFSLSASYAGVVGESQSPPFGIGVLGRSRRGIGVAGVGPNVGVVGNSTQGAGVYGTVEAGSRSPGVVGTSDFGDGVHGISTARGADSRGVVGASSNGIGVYGITHSPSGYGGYFFGGLVVRGPKSAAVPHPDGSHRLLYSMESPESWFEDFGRAKLVRGRARVKLEATFAAVVRTEDYHVFLSPEGETNGLYVSGRNRFGFEVREHRRGTSNVTFSYRVVARRKDIKAPRLQRVVLPSPRMKDLLRRPKGIKLSELPAARRVPRPAPRATSAKSQRPG